MGLGGDQGIAPSKARLLGAEQRRTWLVLLDSRECRIDVIYAALLGWMSIEVDGERRARGWREFQAAFGGATLACLMWECTKGAERSPRKVQRRSRSGEHSSALPG
jgi:hypothetical protein